MGDARTIKGDGGVPISTTTNEGVTSLYVVSGITDTEVATINIDDIALTTGYMLVDLSDTTNWPHTPTGHINLLYLLFNLDPDTNFRGDIAIGFLSNVDGNNGDFNLLHEIHLDKKAEPEVIVEMNFGSFGVSLQTNHWFGPTTLNDATWQTDVNLRGPDGTTEFPAGNGDLVMLVTRSAGEISIGLTVGYVTM